MKVILDTNVFVSGVFFTGPPYRILEAWRDGKLQLVISEDILEEYRRVGEVLAERFPSIELRPFLTLMTVSAEMALSKRFTVPLCDDPDDDMFIACALAGKCKMIVSGDKHLLKMSGFHGIRVISPRGFVDQYLGG
ncbi:MAG: putative toxin-antitoxin system toxin component, PIN family [Syntrophales bacterium]|nr:putative toxin-antitoxin system toxin component, PIN family [Syntrophales bacterium]